MLVFLNKRDGSFEEINCCLKIGTVIKNSIIQLDRDDVLLGEVFQIFNE